MASINPVDAQNILDKYIGKQSEITAADEKARNNTALTKLTGDYTTFLKLLTAQLQHQDPLQPTDPSEYTKQLVSFSGVEQQISTNTKLDQLLAANKNSTVTSLLNYLGRYAEADTNGVLPLQGSSAQMTYYLPSPAKDAEIVIKNEQGAVVRTLDISKSIGMHRVTWDGKDASDVQLPDGLYKFEVVAKDANNAGITPDYVRVVGKVTGVASGDFGPEISMGELIISEASISAVRDSIMAATQ